MYLLVKGCINSSHCMQSSYTFIKRLSIMCTLDDLLSIQHKHFSIISCPLLVHHDAIIRAPKAQLINVFLVLSKLLYQKISLYSL